MNRWLSGLLVLAFGSIAFAGGDADKFKGTWRIVAMEQDGEKAPDDVVKKLDIQIIFEGNKYTEKIDGKVAEDGTFKAEAGKLELNITSGKDKGKKQLALYKFEGDRLVIALAPPGAEMRPESFTTKPGGGYGVHTLEREKAK